MLTLFYFFYVKYKLMSVDINEADFEDIETCASIALLGKRRAGKTTWAKRLIESLNAQMDRFVVLCGNKDNASEWKRVIHPLYVMPKNLAYLKSLRNYQDEKVAKFSENQLPIPRKYRVTVIIDDCGSDRNFMHSDIMKDLLSNGRHYGITLMILCQYLNQMHSENRDQIDYLGVLYTSNKRNIKKVHEEYVNMCDIRTFSFVLNACTSKKGMCWINNTKNPSSIEQCVFFKRMTWPYEFKRVGSQHIRKYGNTHFLDVTDKSTSSLSLSNTKQYNNPFSVGGGSIDTDSDDSTKNDFNLNTNDIPPHILSNKSTFQDKKGAFVVKKVPSKQKVE